MAQLQVEISTEALAFFCRRWGVSQLALFGSVLRPDFRPDSDIDVLVTFAAGRQPSAFERGVMAEELGRLFGRPVDLVDRRAVEESPNYIRRRQILNSAETVYGA